MDLINEKVDHLYPVPFINSLLASDLFTHILENLMSFHKMLLCIGYIIGLTYLQWSLIRTLWVWGIRGRGKDLRRQLGTRQWKTNWSNSTLFLLQKYDTPWFKIWTSPAVWAIIIAHFCNNWGFYTFLTCLPSYFKEVLNFSLSQVRQQC